MAASQQNIIWKWHCVDGGLRTNCPQSYLHTRKLKEMINSMESHCIAASNRDRFKLNRLESSRYRCLSERVVPYTDSRKLGISYEEI